MKIIRKITYPLLTLIVSLIAVILGGCREENVIFIPEEIPTGKPQYTSVEGFYLLNEGNMGSNKCTLDRYDYLTATYTRNIYSMANPDVPKELGDVGNDLQCYGSRLYAVVNCSNKVEVMDIAGCRRLGQVDIPNCRYIAFHKGYAYVTSYAGPVDIDENYAQLGFVARVDTATLEVTGRCIVGYQPDGLAVVGDRLYVANSGGYRVPNYENTLSVIDLNTFTQIEQVPIAINLSQVTADRQGKLWISSRGNYEDIPSRLYCYDTRKARLVSTLDLPVQQMWLHGDSLFTVSSGRYEPTGDRKAVYGIVDVLTMQTLTRDFLSEEARSKIRMPYGIAVNPVTRDIYVTDARTYVNPGYLYAFTPDGSLLWSVRTGDRPARITFF